MNEAYHWLKALHLIAVISWMAGMLYLPRLYVYHAGLKPGSEASELLKIMEARLLRFIVNPAMIATWLLGLGLAHTINAFSPENGHWLHAKLALVLGLTFVHILLARHRRQFAADRNTKTARYYKLLNESVTLLMIGIVLLVVLKPI